MSKCFSKGYHYEKIKITNPPKQRGGGFCFYERKKWRVETGIVADDGHSGSSICLRPFTRYVTSALIHLSCFIQRYQVSVISEKPYFKGVYGLNKWG